MICYIAYHLLYLYESYLLGDMPYNGISPLVSVRIFIYLLGDMPHSGIVAYHLLYLYESLLFLYCLFLEIFVPRLSQKALSLWFSNFHSIFALIRNRHIKLFNMITQPWRHPGAILWIHVIIHIFITIHSKSTIFKFSHSWPFIRPCERVKVQIPRVLLWAI